MSVQITWEGIVAGECSWCHREKDDLIDVTFGPGAALSGRHQLCDRCYKRARDNSIRKKKPITPTTNSAPVGAKT